MEYLSTENILEQYSALLMMTLPSPRVDYYTSANFAKTKKGVLDYSNQIVEALGLYPITAQNTLL